METVKIEGLDELTRAIEKLTEKLDGGGSDKKSKEKSPTFKFIQENYAKIREPGLSHSETVDELEGLANEEELKIDKKVWNKSLDWWKENYKRNYKE